MVLKTVLFLLLSLNIYALEYIKQTYYIDSHDINSSLFFKNQKNIKLYEIPNHKYSLRIKRSQLKKLFIDNGFKNFSIESNYIYFELNSPIDTSKIETFLINHYKTKYQHINIKKVSVNPRSYMPYLPDTYTVDIRDRNHLSNEGVLSIEDNQNKKYFFNYTIDADLNVLKAKKNISRDEELSMFNCKTQLVKLEKFRAMPLQKLQQSKFQAKYRLKADTHITRRDVKKLNLVKRDTQVTVFVNNSGMSISFAAKALQSGKLNDIITVQKSDGKRLKARVVAKQRVEIK
ncbi:flagellar basal body P-ring formation chaperone FlgA [Sulfurimonas sp.]|uniref:flagellar basal body P-ring formation chaperone FlgA n=1 Tax=Sulfurimonas sp. TaxID=2022749 RepID=UPI003569CD6D